MEQTHALPTLATPAPPSAPLQFTDGHKAVQVAQSASLGNTVVWNPGADKCGELKDMPADGWRHMLCVEAAQVYEPIRIEPGDFWQGAQRLRVC